MVNMKIFKLMGLLLVISLGNSGCATKKEITKSSVSMLPKKTIVAIGYGTAETNRYGAAQRRLMGMRASKVEAYRAMVEQIYGIHIDSNTTIENMAAKYDRLRSYVDAIVRGARVKRISALDAETFETVLEVDLTPQIYECFMGSNTALNSCINSALGMPVSKHTPDYKVDYDKTRPVAQLAACNTGDCYHYPDVSGFTSNAASPNYFTELLRESSTQLFGASKQLYDGNLTVTNYY